MSAFGIIMYVLSNENTSLQKKKKVELVDMHSRRDKLHGVLSKVDL